MSQLSIGIGIRIDVSGGLSAGAGGEAYVEHNAYSPSRLSAQADTEPGWTLLTGVSAGIQQTNNIWYPAKTTSYTGVRWSTLPVALATNDNYMQFEAYGPWNANGDYIGPAVRMAADTKSFYSFAVDGNSNYVLKKVFEGTITNHVGTLAAPITKGDIIRVEAEGDVVRGYVNGELIESFTDTGDKNTTGDPGIYVTGLAAANSIVVFRAGDLATEGNLGVFGDFSHAPQDDRYLTDTCFNNSEDNLIDGSSSGTALHFVNHVPHHIELDFLDFRVPSKIRVYGTSSDYTDWSNVDVLTKVAIEDDWTEVATALDLDNDGAGGWKTSGDFSILQPCRYMRIEINATLQVNDFIGANEVEFFCTSQP